jgi:hypothetical protein
MRSHRGRVAAGLAVLAAIASGCTPVLPPRADAPPVVLKVDPASEWRDTGIAVHEGELLYVTATGEVTWETRRATAGPDGVHGSPGWLRAGGLVGRVSTSSKTFEIGARTQPFPDKNPRSRVTHPPPPIRMPATGTLVLGFKDYTPGANAGSFEVTVQRTR